MCLIDMLTSNNLISSYNGICPFELEIFSMSITENVSAVFVYLEFSSPMDADVELKGFHFSWFDAVNANLQQSVSCLQSRC